jgi:hypothetical protein
MEGIPMKRLTAKQEKFSRGVAGGLSLVDAYKDAYDVDGMAPDTVYREASRVMSSHKIATRVDLLLSRLAVLADIDLASVAAEMEEARRVARGAEVPQVSAMIAASKAKANLVGLLQPTVRIDRQVGVELERFRNMHTTELAQYVDAQYRELDDGKGADDGTE